MAETDADLEDLVAKFKALSVTLEMTEDAIVVIKKTLLDPLEKEERRALDETLLELVAKRAKITNMMIALSSDATVMSPPSSALVKQMARLADKVDEMSRANVVASEAVKATGQVLDVASKVLA